MSSPSNKDPHRFLDGQLLVAMPGMTDSRFERAVIYLCAHSAEGAMGIVVNQRAKKVSFPELLVQLDVIEPDEATRLPAQAGTIPVIKGGPVETGRGFVLHSADYFVDSSTLPIDRDISLTATIDILRAIAKGHGPDRAILALGYAGWAAGSSKPNCRATAGSTARATRPSCSTARSTPNTTGPCTRSASTP